MTRTPCVEADHPPLNKHVADAKGSGRKIAFLLTFYVYIIANF